MPTRHCALAVLLVALVVATPVAQQLADPGALPLPIRRVVLYKSGIGYFEHVGSVTGASDVTLRFTSGQLDDVLKSLTALDLDGGQIASIGYNSVASIDRRLQSLRVPLGAGADALQLYGALRGARVSVRGAFGSIDGLILGVERKRRLEGGQPVEIDTLTVISDNGTVRSVVLEGDTTVRIEEAELRDELQRYMAVVASGRDEDVRQMVLSASGTGTRRLFVSYVSEVPIWKSTYRLILPETEGEAPLLQGWAIVDNTVGEDWTDVDLSLVAGAPQAFIQQISQPLYARRAVVPLPQTALLAPQTHQATLEAGQGTAGVGALNETVTVTGDVPVVDVQNARRSANQGRVIVDGRSVSGSAGGVAGMTGGFSPGVDEAARSLAVAAEGQELGDLFEYRLSGPVTIRQDRSALVPILSAPVEAERVSLWSRTPGTGRPLRALWLTNTTGLTLDGGTFSVLDAGAFAGEGLVEALRPGEQRLLSYGADLGVTVDARLDDTSGRYRRVAAADGVVIAEQAHRATWVYRIRNEDAAARALVVEHPIRQGWTLEPDPAPAERTAAAARFRLPVAAGGEATLTVRERRTEASRLSFEQVDENLFTVFEQGGIPIDALRRALQPVVAQRAAVAALETRLIRLREQMGEIEMGQQRVRGNLEVLGDSASERALVERYVRDLGAQEDRLVELREQTVALTTELNAAQDALARVIADLSFEVVAG